MTDFGDLEPDDVFGVEPADPEQVARRLHEMRRDEAFDDGRGWDELTAGERALLIVIIGNLLDWLRRQGSNF